MPKAVCMAQSPQLKTQGNELTMQTLARAQHEDNISDRPRKMEALYDAGRQGRDRAMTASFAGAAKTVGKASSVLYVHMSDQLRILWQTCCTWVL